VKIVAKVVAHGRYLVFQMAEVAVPPELPGHPRPDRPFVPAGRGAMLTQSATPTSLVAVAGPTCVRRPPDDCDPGAEPTPARRVATGLPTRIWWPEAEVACQVAPKRTMGPPGGGMRPPSGKCRMIPQSALICAESED